MANLIFKKAGISPQMAPPINPAKNMRGMITGAGRCGPQLSPTQVPKMAPIKSWLSAPMFQNLALKAMVSPTPIRIRGMALVTVSLKPYTLPNEPPNILVMANSGLTPKAKKTSPITNSPAKIENRSAST